jgi:hypothetical protein
MLLRQNLFVFVIALLLSPGIGCADEYRPSSYDECITDSMRGVGSDVAARAIIASCRNQFPSTAPVETRQDESVEAQAAPAQPVEATQRQEQTAPGPSRNLTSEELQNLKSSAFILADSYRVTIQNKNEHVTITEVTVAVWNASNPDVRRSYTLPVTVLPHGSGRVTFKDVDPDPHNGSMWSDGSEYHWSIVAGAGSDPI